MSALLALEPALRRLVLHTWLEGRARPAASRAGVLAVESLLEVPGSAHRSLAGGCRAVKEYDRLCLVCGRGADRATTRANLAGAASPALPQAAVPLAVPGEVEWQGATIRAERVGRLHDARRIPGGLHRRRFATGTALGAWLPPGRSAPPVRSPGHAQAAGRLRRPAGAGGADGRRWPLVMSGERIVWVCGLVQAEEGRITGHTKDIVRLSWGRT